MNGWARAAGFVGGCLRGCRERLGRAPLVAGVLAVVFFDLWLIADQEIVAVNGPHDDLWFLSKALCWYWFDEGYSEMSFIKEPVYPLFIAICYQVGVPLRLALEGVYLTAAGLLTWAVVQPHQRASAVLPLFAVIALHPQHYPAFFRALQGSIFASLLMLALGALLLQFKRRGQPGCWWRRLGSGLALGLLWNTRPERPWLLALILAFLAGTAVAEWKHHPTLGARLRSWLGEWTLPLGVLAAITLAIMGANYARWGVFAVTDMQASGFRAAQRALMSIKPEHPERYAPVSWDTLGKAYAVSPSFREMVPVLGTKPNPKLPLLDGNFFWLLRAAVSRAGHCKSACDSEAYYRRVAEEINAAAAEGRLPTQWSPFTSYGGFNPNWDLWLPDLPPSFRDLWLALWDDWQLAPAAEDQCPGWVHPLQLPAYNQFYDQAACRRPINRAPDGQAKVRSLIGAAYNFLMHAAVANACLLALAVLVLRRAATGWRGYLLTGGVFATAGLLSLGFMAAYRAMLCPGLGTLYLFPTCLLFTILTVWLLADGIRLLGGALRRSFVGSPAGLSAAGLRPRLTRARVNTILVLGLTLAALVFVSLELVDWKAFYDKLDAVYHEDLDAPDTTPAPADCREVRCAVEPVEVNQMSWQDRSGTGWGPGQYLAFDVQVPTVLGLDPPLAYNTKRAGRVYGIRLTYAYENPIGPLGRACFRLDWRKAGQTDCQDRVLRWLDTAPGERTLTVWVNDTIDRFRIHPDTKPCIFKLTAITLLLPPDTRELGPGPVLGVPFARAQAAEPVILAKCDGKDVLKVHAPSTVEFDVPARARRTRIAGRFGILSEAYRLDVANPGDRTDGVQFAVEYTAQGKDPVVLFERFLDPYPQPWDRGTQEFAVELPPGDKGKVVLKASNPPGKHQHWDWSYWTDVDIEAAEPAPTGQPQASAKAGESSRWEALVQRVQEPGGRSPRGQLHLPAAMQFRPVRRRANRPAWRWTCTRCRATRPAEPPACTHERKGRKMLS